MRTEKLNQKIYKFITNKILNGFISNILLIVMLVFTAYGIFDIFLRGINGPTLVILDNSFMPQFLIAYSYSLVIFGVFAIILIYKYRIIGFIIWNLAENLFDGLIITKIPQSTLPMTPLEYTSFIFWSPASQIIHDTIIIIAIIILVKYKLIYSGKRILLVLIVFVISNYPIYSFNSLIILDGGNVNEMIVEIITIAITLLIVNFKNLNEFMRVNKLG